MKFLTFSASLLLASQALGAVIPLNGEEDIVSREIETPGSATRPSKREDGPAPLLRVLTPAPSRYVVIYNDDVTDEEREQDSAWITDLVEKNSKREEEVPEEEEEGLKFFDFASVKGYSGYFSTEALKEIQENPLVDHVEEDEVVELASVETQKNAPWGLRRLSTREKVDDPQYVYDTDGGKGVTAYVIDSGIKYQDREFQGRASYGTALVFPYNHGDIMGHGTHVAGTIGSKTYGVAKQVKIIAVDITSMVGNIQTSHLLQGLDYVYKDHMKTVADKPKGYKGSVLNLSIQGFTASSVTKGVDALIDVGVHVVAASGNKDIEVCSYSLPKTKAIIVGAVDKNDTKTWFSNYGPCVDIHAPGERIESVGRLWSPSKKSGTSFAAPHVSGLLAYFISLHPDSNSEFSIDTIKPSDLKTQFLKYATKGVIKGLPEGTPNYLAYNGGANPLEFWGEN
ncbi:hypothetical protein FT663_04825 [Candidozyma haemuli var. vulneris]|uniref:Peptidase S8/S53 domain-containing protein n=1 Tax=Candidozyma haemuli TaxID=45357 RepID=A0A2V1AZP3_9ASCO|nr:hypothetical protein CXQ85_005379 [[Candida] haemuloni]KAF3985754.1 hypothetical protein FT662_04957 [[Candida] haemuloni var. vulneris]KAF3986586.1 hypothetical protein FT663_04825 [[Candida] haemuloni var. vulneris]PVH22351.1 hypothetical protein CXQ85_005379 [[Candida] haemuloni]